MPRCGTTPRDPQNPDNDRFVLSKGHAAPILYAAWAEAGFLKREDLLTLRRLDSDLEGHPTPRLPLVDVATGSLGQGLCAGVGIALNARRIGSDYRTYVLLGDGESAEGSVWEAADVAAYHKLDSLCGITDVNALGQSGPTQLPARYRGAGRALAGIRLARADRGRPRPAGDPRRAREGASDPRPADDDPREDAEGQGHLVHGREGRLARQGAEEGRGARQGARRAAVAVRFRRRPRCRARSSRSRCIARRRRPGTVGPTAYKLGDSVATREAYGAAIARLAATDDRIVALDADVKNSTFSEKFEQQHPQRFYQNFIAEQAMIGAAMGLASRGAIPFPSTFAAFLTRAYDFIRMAAISNLNVKMAGSHAGVSIGEDGPSQMALEDLAMMRAEPNIAVLYPCDGVSTEKLIERMAYHPGPVYMRTSRPKTPVIYGPDETFTVGGLKVLRESADDVATVVGGGVTVFEALKAYDELKAQGINIRVVDLYSLQPIDAATLVRCARETKGRVDHRGGPLRRRRDWRRGGVGDRVRRVHGAAARRPRDSPQRDARAAARSLRHLRPPHRRGRVVGTSG